MNGIMKMNKTLKILIGVLIAAILCLLGARAAFAMLDDSDSRVNPFEFNIVDGFAIYDSQDKSLNFYRDYDVPSVGGKYVGADGVTHFIDAVYTGYENTQYSDATAVPWTDHIKDIQTVSFIDTTLPKYTDHWFDGASNLSTVKGTSVLDTRYSLSFANMFKDCEKLESVDITSWNISTVKSLSGMFEGCTLMDEVDLSGLDTSSVEDVSNMFKGMTTLSKVEGINDLNMSKLSNMSGLFDNCSAFTKIDLSNWKSDTDVLNMDNAFANCTNAKTIDISGLILHNSDSMDGAFSNDSVLTTIYVNKSLTDFSNESVGVFENSNNLIGGLGTTYNGSDAAYTRIDGAGDENGYFTPKFNLTFYQWDGKSLGTASGQYKYGMRTPAVPTDFGYWAYYSNNEKHEFREGDICVYDPHAILDINLYPYKDVDYTYNMIDWASYQAKGYNLATYGGWDFDGYTKDEYYYTQYDIANTLTVVITDEMAPSDKLLNYKFDADEDGGVIGWRDGNVYYISTCTPGQKVIAPKDCSKLFGNSYAVGHVDVSGMDFSQVTTMNKMFYNDGSSYSPSVTFGNYVDLTNCKDVSHLISSNRQEMLDLSGWKNTGNIEDMSYMVYSCSNLTEITGLNALDTSSVTNMSYMFAYNYKLTQLDLSGWNTSNVTNMSYMFQNCSVLTFLNLSGFDTSNVTNMRQMFYYNSELVELIGLDDWDTSKVTSFYQTFSNCQKLEVLDLTSWTASSLSKSDDSFYDMFYQCNNLKTIYSNQNWNTQTSAIGQGMFSYCYKLIGGKGTVYDSSTSYNSSWSKYAHVDGGSSNHGYFTPKFDVSFEGTDINTSWSNELITPDVDEGYVSWKATLSSGDIVVCYPGEVVGYYWGKIENLQFAPYNPPHINFDYNGGELNGQTTNQIDALSVKSLKSLGTKIAHTSNVNDDGTTNSSTYTASQSVTNTVTITGAEYLDVKLTYSTSSVYNAWVCLYPSNITPTSSNYSSSITGRLGGGSSSRYTNTYRVDGNTVKCYFYSSSSSSRTGYGYYAVVEGFANVSETVEHGTYVEPKRDGYYFAGWSTEVDATEPNVDYSINLVKNKDSVQLYAVWKELIVEPFAVYSETDQSLNFYNRIPPIQGETYNYDNVARSVGKDLVATKVYRGITENTYTYQSVPWAAYRDKIKTVNVYDEFAPTSMSYWFNGLVNTTSIEGLPNIDVSNTTSMVGTFASMHGITELDVHGWDTSNVTAFGAMNSITPTVYDTIFADCTNLETIYVSDTFTFDGLGANSPNGLFMNSSKLIGGKGSIPSVITTSDFGPNKASGIIDGLGNVKGLFTPYTSVSFAGKTSPVLYKYGEDIVIPENIEGFDGWYYQLDNGKKYVFNEGDIFEYIPNLYFENIIMYPYSIPFATLHSNEGVFTNDTDNWVVQEIDVPSSITEVTKYAHSHNVNDAGVATSTTYNNNLSTTTTVTIPGAEQLNITITYQTESTSYDWVCIYLPGITPSATNFAASVTNKLGGSTKTARTYTIPGDTAQFYFRTDGSGNSYYGYYAIITADVVSEPDMSAYIPTRDGYEFLGWSTEEGAEEPNIDLTPNTLAVGGIDLYAVWAQLPEQTFAFYSATDYSLNFYKRRVELPTQGSTFVDREGNSKVVTALYKDIETTNLTSSSNAPWYSYRTNIKSVNIMDEGIKPLNTYYWFYGFSNSALTSIDASKFDMSECVNTSYMFYGCTYLTSVGDLNNWDTGSVTNMSYMFYNDSKLTELTIKNWNVSQVTTMSYMFYSCYGLPELDLSNWNTEALTNMDYMFRSCSGLTKLDMSNWNSSKLSTLYGVFAYCSKLPELDLSSWDSSNITNMGYNSSSTSYYYYGTFAGCSVLETIYVSPDWNLVKSSSYTYHTFYNCTKLVGGQGTKYSSSNTSRTFARIDGVGGTGYFTPKINVQFEEVDEEATLFKYGVTAPEVFDNGEYWTYTTDTYNVHNFNAGDKVTYDATDIKDLVLTMYRTPQSFVVYSETDGSLNFYHRGIIPVQGETWNDGNAERVATSVWTDFEETQFANPSACPWYINAVDYQKYKSATIVDGGIKPKYMDYWFANIGVGSDIKNINGLDKIDTSECTSMKYLFNNAQYLTSLDLSAWDTSKVTNMSDMFYRCVSLTSINLAGWDTSNVTNMDSMFGTCSKLKTVYATSSFVTTNVESVNLMFSGCNELVGGEKTKYNRDNDELAYAHVDYGTENPGYFTNVETTAFAVYSSSDNSLTFYNRQTVPEQGSIYAGKLVSNVYENVESIAATSATAGLPWAGRSANIEKVSVADNGIKVNSMAYWFANTPDGIQFSNLNKLDTSEMTSMKGAFTTSKLNGGEIHSLYGLDTSAVTDMSYMFSGCTNLTLTDDMQVLNLNKVENISYMFNGCTKLETMEQVIFAASPLKNLNHVFSGCTKLQGIDMLSGWNVSQVSDMSYAFYNCSSLVDACEVFRHWKSNVSVTMSYMFYGCTKLSSDVSDMASFKTSTTTNMRYMFYNCKALTNPNFNKWDTSNVTDMSYMFYGCTNLDACFYYACSWDVSKVTTMAYMFYGCTSLTIMNALYGWNCASLENMSYMFSGCTSLTTAELPVQTPLMPALTTTTYMFSNCKALQYVRISYHSTPSLANTSYMFNNCTSLTDLNVASWDVGSVTNMSYMFNNCSALKELNTYGWDTSNVTNMKYMFYGCSSLTTIGDSSTITTPKVTTMEYMFAGCSSLKTIDKINTWDTSSLTDMEGMFGNCSSLTTLDLSSWNTSKLKYLGSSSTSTSASYLAKGAFYNCSSLKTIYVGDNWSTSSVSNKYHTFYGCTSIVGGAGTTFDSTNTSAVYARVDGGTSSPGYLTKK